MKFNETAYKDNLVDQIKKLKKETDAYILAHNYQRDEIQAVADLIGDSLELSRAAVKVRNKVIVFCGVHFMAECAAILNPTKTVLLPVKEAGCPLADMATPEKLRDMKKKYPGVPVVCYVNSSAAVKAESDICVTSANAVKVVNAMKEKRIIFIPDKNLGTYVSQHTDKEVILWEGFCATHINLTEEEVVKMKKLHPGAKFLAHPECRKEVLALTDHIASTSGILRYVKESPEKEFIIGTESGILYRLKQMNPDKKFYLPSQHLTCANMKLTTLGWLTRSLKNMQYKVTVKEPIAAKARRTLERMLEIV
jgi:quinolinate synthase